MSTWILHTDHNALIVTIPVAISYLHFGERIHKRNFPLKYIFLASGFLGISDTK